MCPSTAHALGFTVVDLSETWTPRLFAPDADGVAPRYRETYLELARDAGAGELPPEDRLVEMYGVVPAPSVVLGRLADEPRHACHDAIDNAPLAEVTRPLAQAGNKVIDAADRKRRSLGAWLERQRRQRKLPDLAALERVPSLRKSLAYYTRVQHERDAIEVAQRHLVCEHLLGERWVDGKLYWRTGDALDYYQRQNFLLPDGKLDADTREAMTLGSRELAYRAALRLLRERVVDATGLIEDGTAGAGPRKVIGRWLEPEIMRAAKGYGPMAGAAPDLIGAATEQAALALGWTGPQTVRTFLQRHLGQPLHVALALAPPPAYHGAHMDLSAEIDRGDVWYDLQPRYHKPARRPALILYATVDGARVPLLRWPTTIGGWADQRMPSGRIRKQWKESDVGPRVWKDLYAAPTWNPPASTPDKDLVRNLWNGHWRLNDEVLGPGPRSAYGMAMLVMSQPIKLSRGRVRYDDNGIRVHGSATVTSVVTGTSHGCHRLLNHLAVRLSSFLLAHRDHVRRGEQLDPWRRVVRHKGEVFRARLDTRGFLYELTPPVPVEVLPGRIRSERKRPPPRR
ncbi:MAG: hypothetical protein H6709_08420 [Kofleriaceae bacterium]|nr:hypothetical protein [Kofleriaceae bacterium]